MDNISIEEALGNVVIRKYRKEPLHKPCYLTSSDYTEWRSLQIESKISYRPKPEYIDEDIETLEALKDCTIEI